MEGVFRNEIMFDIICLQVYNNRIIIYVQLPYVHNSTSDPFKQVNYNHLYEIKLIIMFMFLESLNYLFVNQSRFQKTKLFTIVF